MIEDVVRFTGAPSRIDAGDGIVLRTWSLADCPEMVAAINANLEHLRPWMPWAQAPATDESATEFLRACVEGFEAGTQFNYAIDVDGETVGSIGLMGRIGPGALEIGYWVSVAHSGRGIVTMSARALTEAARAIDGCTRVEIHCDEANLASAAIPRRLGYTLARVDEIEPETPAETGRRQIWVFDLA